MSGLGRKVFTAGEVLTAADVNGYLMDQTVMVFADATARTAAIAEPSEGMLTYLEDTNAYESWNGAAWANIAPTSPITTEGDLITGDATGVASRIGIGSTDQVLTVVAGAPTWAAAGGGSITLLSTTTASGATTTISSINQTYENLIITMENITVSADDFLTFRPRVGSTTIAAKLLGTGVNASPSFITESSNFGTPNQILSGTQENSFFISINNYAGSSNNRKKRILTVNDFGISGARYINNLQGFLNSTTTGGIDGFQIATSGTYTGGTIKIYGVK